MYRQIFNVNTWFGVFLIYVCLCVVQQIEYTVPSTTQELYTLRHLEQMAVSCGCYIEEVVLQSISILLHADVNDCRGYKATGSQVPYSRTKHVILLNVIYRQKLFMLPLPTVLFWMLRQTLGDF